MIPGRLRHGIFLAPFHPLAEDPTQALHRDLELVSWLDELGYDEAWIGEHHSAGYEIIASPELFIAAAAERTKRIMLGTGVVSLPYHNPLMVANRIIQLDHMTRGRVILGVGPGLLPSDAFMLGIPVSQQRPRMLESLDVILRLFAGETVTEETEWYNLQNARAHLLPYTRPRPEICVASTITPSGGRAGGNYGLGNLRVAATQADGVEVLGAGPLRTRLQGSARRGLTRFVGRHVEMEQMQQALEQAKEGHGQIVGVMGEPGLGKSRLFYEFKLTSQSGWGAFPQCDVFVRSSSSRFQPVIVSAGGLAHGGRANLFCCFRGEVRQHDFPPARY